MPRTITALGGLESQDNQIPVSLVRLEISGNEKRMHDLDVTLYLNPSTDAVSMSPGGGLLAFTPYAGLEVPSIDIGDDQPLGEVTFTASNISEDWFVVMAANAYRETAATIWQGNLSLAAGTAPDAATFQGVVKMWAGKLVHIVANRQTATFRLEPPDPFRQPLPWRTYDPTLFKHLPPQGKKFIWGYTEREI